MRAGNVISHTGVATEVLCGATPEEAAQVALAAFPDPMERTAAGEPAFEVWRQRIGVALGVPSTT